MRKKLSRNLIDYWTLFLAVCLALVVVLAIGRGYEIVILILQHAKSPGVEYFLLALINDLQLGVFLAPLILGLGWLTGFLFGDKTRRSICALLIGTLGIINILLISYYGATLVLLGADFWAYSISELTSTVMATERVTFLGILALLGAYFCFIWIARSVLSFNLVCFSGKKSVSAASVIIAVLFFGPSIITVDTTAPMQEEQRANKFSYFVSESVSSISLFGGAVHSSQFKEDYPLLRKAKHEDVLGPFFEEFESPPNIVFILVESLGGEFVGPNGQWTGFAPYLDSLVQEGLYWENGLSLSGRTFGLVPSLLGSLPFGDNGFMDLGPDYPAHQSLISLLDQRGYYTAFYSGYNTNFDGLNLFLEYQGTDFILNKQKLDRLLPEAKATQNYWGVDDKTMLNFASSMLDTARTFPRLEVYHTLQSHSPFTVPNPDKYERQLDARLETLNVSQSTKESFRQYRSELITLMFADQAVQDFMESYQKRKQFENTIFVFTGDHWLIPVPQTTAISRYHVPIIIYSPKLGKPVHFKSVNTHANIAPTLTAFLDQQTTLTMPDSVHWLGGVMDTSRQFQSRKSVPLMRNKNRISDYLHENYYLYGDELYELNEGMTLEKKEKPQIKNRIAQKLQHFKEVNQYVTTSDKLYPGDDAENQKYAFLAKYDTLFAHYDSLGLSIDRQFERARQYAFDENFPVARAIAKRILMKTPNYTDVRILLGRTYAWDGQHGLAKKYFEEALERDSTYFDIYNAYFDNEYWAGNYQQALEIINRGLELSPGRSEFLKRKIKVLSALSRYKMAQQVFDDLRQSSGGQDLSGLKKYLSK